MRTAKTIESVTIDDKTYKVHNCGPSEAVRRSRVLWPSVRVFTYVLDGDTLEVDILPDEAKLFTPSFFIENKMRGLAWPWGEGYSTDDGQLAYPVSIAFIQRRAHTVDEALLVEFRRVHNIERTNTSTKDAMEKGLAVSCLPNQGVSGQRIGKETKTARRFRVLDYEWRHITVDGDGFDLKNRKQIKAALHFLYEGGHTSQTGDRATVAAVCFAAGQKAEVPNLHSIFHVAGGAESPNLDYDRLYDLVIDNQKGKGVLLKT